jgi:predicted cupin superfamily sugar epimerase
MTPLQWIAHLQLVPHPEGGHYRECYRSPQIVSADDRCRSAVTIIHFLLRAGEHSRWHVVASDEIWRHSAGGPLELLEYTPATRVLTVHRLGPLDDSGASLTHIIPAGHWQAARPLGDYTLVECTVAPGFDFADFQMVADLAEYADRFDNELRVYRDLR